jgi:hypothetical protein
VPVRAVSLAEQYEARIVSEKPPAILTVDIERLPGWAKHQHRGLTVEGPFWDLNSWKHTIGYRLPPASVVRWPRTICAAWRWYGNKRVEFAAEWDEGGREAFLRKVWDAYDAAEIVYGHNVDAFDTKKLQGEWTLIGLGKPSPFTSVDTLKVARRALGFESNQLGALCERLGIPTKVDKYDPDVAQAACDGDVKAQRRLRIYNQGDIVASEALVDRIRGLIPGHPHIGLYTGDEDCCGACGGKLEPSGFAPTAVTLYAAYRCTNCQAWYRRTNIKARTNTRPAR